MLLAFTLLSSAQPSFTCTTGAVLIQLIAFTWRQLPEAQRPMLRGANPPAAALPSASPPVVASALPVAAPAAPVVASAVFPFLPVRRLPALPPSLCRRRRRRQACRTRVRSWS